MKPGAKAKYLIVDTSGFIRNLQFQDLTENVITLEEVLKEIKSRRQLRRLTVLPYDMTIKSVFPENIQIVSQFSKETGDYPSLSAVDMKVMALTYQLEKEFVGTDHLKITPDVQKTVENYNPADESFNNVAGFYNKDKRTYGIDGKSVVDESDHITCDLKSLNVCEEIDEMNNHGENIEEEGKEELPQSLPHEKTKDAELKEEDCIKIQEQNFISKGHITLSTSSYDNEEKSSASLEKCDLSASPPDENIELGYSSDNEDDPFGSDQNLEDGDLNFDDIKHSEDFLLLKSIDQNILKCDEVSDDDSIYDDDDCGWITPSNIAQAKKDTYSGILSDEPVTVACLTTDFAMQNVLLQMGMNVMSVDGRIIKQVRTYILRCHACGKITSVMTKIFCPKCGLKTLKKVAVSVDPDGKQQIFINYKRQITAKGKRWSIPKPQGGKHANNPVLVEDQRVPQQRISKKAMLKTNALDPDYIAGFSPFAMKDTTSRSVMLGFHTSRQNPKHLINRNPHKGKKKK